MSTETLYGTMTGMFGDYPEAVASVNTSGTIRTMHLAVPTTGGGAGFYTLWHLTPPHQGPSYGLYRWPAREPSKGLKVEPGTPATGKFAHVPRLLRTAVPLPRDGSVYGWLNHNTVTTWMVFYTRTDDHRNEPTWFPMHLESAKRRDWANTAGRDFWRYPFWAQLRAGQIVPLGPSIASAPGTFYWATPPGGETLEAHGVVTAPFQSRDGWRVPAGRFIYDGALTSGMQVPHVPPGECTDMSGLFHAEDPATAGQAARSH
jgi:hypothetical protein